MTFENDHRVNGIGNVLISSRSLAEYRAMFALTDDDLSVRILDCPSGGSSFTSEVSNLGGNVTACDAAYLGNSPDNLAAIALSETDRGNQYVRAHAEVYEWTFFADPDQHQRDRARASQQFAAHIRQHPDRYIAGRLPTLPFPDASFDLVLSSHLLFSYADTLDHTFHVDAITELMRVTSGELRIFPLVAVSSVEPYPQLAELLSDLRERNIAGRTIEVDYNFQKGANQMLVCNHWPYVAQ
ncbi:methyltransferase domain-containing protein [Rhodococcus sp. 24CO]|uniref:methyltransferase domain-containing protein n=1 Tax=Rhodococcus sp. 24CO TaxID=3117460 RepID=UPI003D339035